MNQSTANVVVCLLIATGAWAVADSLGSDSPFRPNAAIGEVTTDAPLELRGVLVFKGESFFRLCHPSSGLALWVGLKEAGNPFMVQHYDADRCMAKVDFQGRSLKLALKQSKVVALEQSQTPVTVEPAVCAMSTDAAEDSDMQIINEIRRRRALHAQAAQHPALQPPANQPNRR